MFFSEHNDSNYTYREAQTIQSKYITLYKQMIRSDDIMKELFTNQHVDFKFKTEFQQEPTEYKKNEKILDEVLRGDQSLFDCFVRALRKTKQDPLAQLLDPQRRRSISSNSGLQLSTPMLTPNQGEYLSVKQGRNQVPTGRETSPENTYVNNKKISKTGHITSPGIEDYEPSATMPRYFGGEKEIRQHSNRAQSATNIHSEESRTDYNTNQGYGLPRYSVQRDQRRNAETDCRTNQWRQANFGEPNLQSQRGPLLQQQQHLTVPISTPQYYAQTGQPITQDNHQSKTTTASERRKTDKTRFKSLPDNFSHSSQHRASQRKADTSRSMSPHSYQTKGGPSQYASHNQPSYNQATFASGHHQYIRSHQQEEF